MLKQKSEMGKRKNKLFILKFLYWLPRILSVCFIIFVSIFALDVFIEPRWFLTLLLHLIPSFILIVVTIIAWRYERVGGIIFIIIGFLFLIFSRFKGWVISFPSIVIGVLFLLKKN